MGSEQIGNSVENWNTSPEPVEAERLESIIEGWKSHPTHLTVDLPSVDNKPLSLQTEELPDEVSPVQSQIEVAGGIGAQTIRDMIAQLSSVEPVKADSVDLIEFQEFKRQVVAAFKHLGLDVRKHFTE